MSEPVVHRSLKISVIVLIAVGVVMAVTALIASVTHGQTAQAWAFLAVASILAAAAWAVSRSVRWVTVVCFVGLAGQLFAVIGSAIELTIGVAAIKQQQLRSIGFDPTVVVTVNLIYSAVGFALFCWAAWRWKTQRTVPPCA
jgi:hypothetical protein